MTQIGAKITKNWPFLVKKTDFFEFFEKIRLSNNNYINISNRKWVHFIDFKIKHFKKDLELKTNSGILDEHLVDSSNKGGVLKSVPNNDYNQFLSLLKSNTVDI